MLEVQRTSVCIVIVMVMVIVIVIVIVMVMVMVMVMVIVIVIEPQRALRACTLACLQPVSEALVRSIVQAARQQQIRRDKKPGRRSQAGGEAERCTRGYFALQDGGHGSPTQQRHMQHGKQNRSGQQQRPLRQLAAVGNHQIAAHRSRVVARP